MPPVNALLVKTRFQARNALRLALGQSRFKMMFILVFAVLFEGLLCLVFHDGFRFLNTFGGAGLMLTGRIFALFFLGLGLMLLVSGIVTAYSTLFGSDEIPFLLVRPFSMSCIVVYKFIQAAGFSSWAFFFVVLPFIGAFTWHQRMSPLFVLWTFLFSIPFLFLFTGLGTLIVLLTVRFLPRAGRFRTAAAVAALVALPVVLSLAGTSADALGGGGASFNIAALVPGLRVAAHPLSPSFWIAEGIVSLTRGAVARGMLLFAALSTNALLAGLVIERAGARVFLDAWQHAGEGGRQRRRPVLLPPLDRLRRAMPPDIAAIIVKDIRTFFRDPVQWSQAVVFFGLLGIYFANLRMFNYDALPDQWRSSISFLNVFAVAAVLSSLGARFVYPQLSLEGHGFWLLGLSPATMPRVIAAKFLLAFAATASVSISLVAISGRMLDTAADVNAAAIAIIAAVSVAVCALSTGLGALFMDLHQRNPAAIVSSFGGTLNIMLCLGFMLCAILPFGVLFHLRGTGVLAADRFAGAMALASLWLASLTLAATALPLWLGLRSLRRRDY